MHENLLQVSNPEICKEWDHEMNRENSLFLETITKGSHAKAWWVCPKGHSYRAIVKNRVSGQSCPFCSGKKVLIGFNDLLTTNPQLAAEWNYKKNILTPRDVTAGSSKKVWWICKDGHEWQAKIANRKNGTNCPQCSGLRCIPGTNDLETLFPELAQEWNYEKNGDLSPSEVKSGSNIKVWWKCRKCGSEWVATPNKRTGEKTGCPNCATTQTSFSEQVVFYYIKKLFPNAIHRHKIEGNELDVFIPNKNIGIEYDGIAYHRDNISEKNDNAKDNFCKLRGIRLFRIREKGLPALDNSFCIIRDDISYHSLEKCIIELLKYLVEKAEEPISIENDFADIQNQSYYESVKKSVSICAPQLAKEWNYEKNGYLKPENIACYSNKKVWWKCKIGHEWMASVAHRMSGQNCPVCAGRKILIGFNDLATTNPLLAMQWDYEKNVGTMPTQVTANSHKKVYWKCKKGHSWCATIKSRNEGNNCPYCSNRIPKSIMCIETGQVFSSLNEASSWAGVTKGCISSAAIGKNNTSGGYHWKYLFYE